MLKLCPKCNPLIERREYIDGTIDFHIILCVALTNDGVTSILKDIKELDKVTVVPVDDSSIFHFIKENSDSIACKSVRVGLVMVSFEGDT